MKTIAKISEETLTLINYLQDMPNGQYLTYKQIQKDTGIKMDLNGKSYLRTALKKLKKEYSCVIGDGIKLASPETATCIVVGKLVKVDRAVRRGEKTVNNITSNFYNEVTPQEQKQLNFLGAVFGAIRVAAKNGKHYLKNATDPIAPMLPENIK